jgi:hypothetical protein
MSVVAAFCVFCSMNLLLLLHAHFIFDYERTYGFPLPVYTHSTWMGSRLSLFAIPIDILALLGVAAVVSSVWKRLSSHRPNTP